MDSKYLKNQEDAQTVYDAIMRLFPNHMIDIDYEGGQALIKISYGPGITLRRRARGDFRLDLYVSSNSVQSSTLYRDEDDTFMKVSHTAEANEIVKLAKTTLANRYPELSVDEQIITALLAKYRKVLLDKEANASLTQVSLIKNRQNSLDNFETLFQSRTKDTLLQKKVFDIFYSDLLKIAEEIENI